MTCSYVKCKQVDFIILQIDINSYQDSVVVALQILWNVAMQHKNK